MGILTGILQFVLVIVCILLVGAILLQRNKGAGAGVTFGGGEAVFGADMGNVLTRSTIVLGFLFVVITIALSIINAHARTAGIGSVTDGLATAPAQTLPAPAPAADAAAEALPEETAEAAPALADEAADEAPAAEAPAEAATAEAAPAEAAPAEAAPAPAEAPAASEE